MKLFLLSLVLALISCNVAQDHEKASNSEELKRLMASAVPGDTIVLAEGEWNNSELVIKGMGTEEMPIVIRAQYPGKTILTGNSNLKIGGEHLVVSGLYFKNGYTLTQEAIAFRIDKNTLANNCRVTQTVVSDYSNPERHESDYWVGMYGKNNRFDHNALVGKGNRGVTMAVRLNTEESQDNNHIIDHNYFGPRENLGSNGGETLRIGTSHYSLSYSNTQVLDNYFDRCDGEHEIISNKSCGNLFQGNTFYECVGTLTYRHGNDNMVRSNAFFGNGKWHTGGIRVINKKNSVINNYGYGLTGHRFRGALVVMNGVPNSPINRYHQVEDAVIRNNTFVNCDYVQLCAGSDAERSAVPLTTEISSNIFWNESKDDVFTIYDDISGISFANNVLSPNISDLVGQGFESVESELIDKGNGIFSVAGGPKGTGITSDFKTISKEETGPEWYVKPGGESTFDFGGAIEVNAGGDLFEIIKSSNPGDQIVLGDGEFLLTKKALIRHPLTIKSNAGAVIKFERSNLFLIENGGSLKLDGVTVDGAESPDYAGNAVISTSKYSMNKNYKLFINNCRFVDLDVNHSFNLLKSYKNTFADSIVITNTTIETLSGSVLDLSQETDDIGIYNAEFVILKNNRFENIGGQIVHLHRGGGDESTFGPLLFIDQCEFENIGNAKKNKSKNAITLHGVQRTEIQNSIFSNTRPIDIFHTVGDPITSIDNIRIDAKSDLTISDNTAKVSGIVTGKEKYKKSMGLSKK